MKILVCIKQVPGTTAVAVDEETGVLLRSGVESKLNPYDLYALETAFKIKEEIGGETAVITMGPPQAAAIVREAFAMGADRGLMLSDRAFAGADVLATSYALAGGVKKAGDFDLIICGKQTTDGDTAQVGPELAEILDIPHMTNVTKIVGLDKPGQIRIEADMGDCMEVFDIDLPCLITVEKGIHTPRLPSYKRMLASADWEVPVLTVEDLDEKRRSIYGLDGSPTKVEKVYPPDTVRDRKTITGDSGTVAAEVFAELRGLKFID